MELIALAIVGLIALSCAAGLLWVLGRQGRLITHMGNQLTANSDHQLQRIKYEAGAEAVGEYARKVVTTNGHMWQPPAESPDMVIPNRG